MEQLLRDGYRAYTTSAGWLGYSESQLRSLCRDAITAGWTHIKVKVGVSLDEDMHRLRVIRDEIGYDRVLMIDANQRWDVATAIHNMKHLAQVVLHDIHTCLVLSCLRIMCACMLAYALVTTV